MVVCTQERAADHFSAHISHRKVFVYLCRSSTSFSNRKCMELSRSSRSQPNVKSSVTNLMQCSMACSSRTGNGNGPYTKSLVH